MANMTWKQWGVALLNAFISASAGSLSSFSAASLLGVNAITSLKIAGLTAVGSGFVSAAKWVSQHSLPGVDQ